MERPALEQIHRRGYELLVQISRSTRVPRGWHTLVQGLDARVQLTNYGLLLSVRSELSSEIDRLIEQVYRMPWADEIAHTWSCEFDEITIYRWRPNAEERALAERSPVHAIEMPFSLAHGVPVTREAVLENRARLARDLDPALTGSTAVALVLPADDRPALLPPAETVIDGHTDFGTPADQAVGVTHVDPTDLPDELIGMVKTEVIETLDMMGRSTIDQLIVYMQQTTEVLRKTLEPLVSQGRVIEQDGVFSLPSSGDRDMQG